MVKIRLSRTGARHQGSYRLVVADSRSPRDSMVIDTIGFYDPLPDPSQVVIDEAKALVWLRRGARPSESVARLLAKSGILEKVGGQE